MVEVFGTASAQIRDFGSEEDVEAACWAIRGGMQASEKTEFSFADLFEFVGKDRKAVAIAAVARLTQSRGAEIEVFSKFQNDDGELVELTPVEFYDARCGIHPRTGEKTDRLEARIYPYVRASFPRPSVDTSPQTL